MKNKKLVFDKKIDLNFSSLELDTGENILIEFTSGNNVIAKAYDIDYEWIMYNVGEEGWTADSNQISRIYKIN
ncbi:MAG: hypothetical protein ACRC18_06515 [Cetobacterium sp.]